MDAKEGISIKSSVGAVEAYADDENMEFSFSAYGLVNIKAALKNPGFQEDSLRKQALKQGRSDLPAKTEESLSSSEMQIVNEAKEALRSGYDEMAEILSAYRSDMIFLETRLSTPKDPLLINSNSLSSAANERLGYKQKLVDQYTQYAEKMRELRYFKKENDLSLDAKEPDFLNKSILFFLVALVVEFIVNGIVLADSSEHGLAGGWANAAFISILNVSAGAIVGYYCLRSLFSKTKIRRLLGVLGTAFITFSIMCFFLFIAHQRDNLMSTMGVDDKGNIVSEVPTFHEAMGNITNFSHWEPVAFIIAGLLIYIFSMIKAYGLSDPYPGYSRIDSACKREKQKYLKLRNHVYECVKNMVNQNKHKIFRMQNNYRKWLHAYKEIPKLVDSHLETYADWQKSIDQQCEAQIKRFRELNKSVRTSPPPPYFSTYDSVVKIKDFTPVEIDKTLYEDSLANMKELESQCADLLKNFQSHIETHVKEFDDFINEIEQDVETKVYTPS
ncbi:hypothetical protein [Teredinibacter turnerae]|uniref:hypothetical protein n=1 Tax=Teredinibacter turnerae TaxID=2426 RepID=UPI00036224A2|nr:hypothetical protein [Teredinibacter turnerae]